MSSIICIGHFTKLHKHFHHQRLLPYGTNIHEAHIYLNFFEIVHTISTHILMQPPQCTVNVYYKLKIVYIFADCLYCFVDFLYCFTDIIM